MNEENIKEKLFLDGEVFDAAKAYINIYKQAKKNIYIILVFHFFRLLYLDRGRNLRLQVIYSIEIINLIKFMILSLSLGFDEATRIVRVASVVFDIRNSLDLYSA